MPAFSHPPRPLKLTVRMHGAYTFEGSKRPVAQTEMSSSGSLSRFLSIHLGEAEQAVDVSKIGSELREKTFGQQPVNLQPLHRGL